MRSKKFLKKALCAVLAITMLFGTTMISAQAKTTETSKTQEYEFENIEDLRKTITQIFVDEYDKIIELARELNPDKPDCKDEYFTFYSHCGPTSAAFRKVLYDDYGYIVETQRANLGVNHIFNLMRVTFADSPDKVSCIVIDTTYKQFVTATYERANLSFDDIANDLPPVLIYEYGNTDEMVQQLKGANNHLDAEQFELMCIDVYRCLNGYVYLPQDFQRFEYNNYNQDTPLNVTSQAMDDLRNNSGKCDYRTDKTPYIFSTSTNAMQEFIYDGNGVYRCCIPFKKVEQYVNGFLLTDKDGNIMYGMSDCESTLCCANFYPQIPYTSLNTVLKMDSEGITPLSIDLQNNNNMQYLMLSIDLRAGTDTPAVYCYRIVNVEKYGDINNDGTVDVCDASYLQKCIVGDESLDAIAKERADVLKCGALSIKNVTAISNYIADNKDFDCGSTLYYSTFSDLKSSAPYGYIDC